MANVSFLRAMYVHRVGLASQQYRTQLRLQYSAVSEICKSHFGRPGNAAVRASLLQKLNAFYCVGSAPSRCIFIESRLRNRVPERKQDNKVSLKRSAPPASTTQKVKEAGKDLTYLLVVLVGIGITGGLFYVIFKELFSSSSPSKIYGDALKKCRAHPEIIGALGEPIKGYGETSRRGRRRHVSHVEYVKDGVKHIQIKFYIEGSEPIKGTVHLDAKENPESGRYDFHYIFVDFDTYPKRTIIVEDNR
ncbi:mitochondrial import inner membrane translocase subunit Tim21 isoform X1 [Carcharodon carcharias]|uniref:mitochondrial import inner membrane translocase subunit Tim21 isoform X1 n=1 Tax=Carcharodon carcharias TaxID=13397 RepID=UPI001B7F0155|nr:mitochondrial import inner membrane translocase subunit Tim21 isoform X1 [Carcharodon carcharias]